MRKGLPVGIVQLALTVILTLAIDGLTSIILILLSTINLQFLGFPGGSVLKNLPANAGDADSIDRWGNPLEKEMAAHFSILAWGVPQTEKSGGLQSMELQKSVRYCLVTKQQ